MQRSVSERQERCCCLPQQHNREMYKIEIINGPNLNMLGIREPDVYGVLTLDQMNSSIAEALRDMPVTLSFFQSNSEGALVDEIQRAYFCSLDGVVINPAAYTHYSIALRDAIAAVPVPFVEVHLSDISSREEFRRLSVTEPVCVRQIAGMGWKGYVAAVNYLVDMLRKGDNDDRQSEEHGGTQL